MISQYPQQGGIRSNTDCFYVAIDVEGVFAHGWILIYVVLDTSASSA